ncbi:Polyphosphate kinase [Handroanthus impetiginosus]|uniref:NAD(P)H-quinone oxidoreductase subunit 5, chloroplastic n=1 Tax=Handroanthus impetiginosus TaxID=429701 RepID=A0A2G9I819_9LAMI|nr:Polyphosphate kinase [Handroanthus impetiginosus]
MGSYRSALLHLITHAYSKALLFLGFGSVIHSMETIVGYSTDKNEILNDSWLYSPIFTIIAWVTIGLIAFYMFRICSFTFEGHLNVYFQNYSGSQNTSLYSISLWDKGCSQRINKNFRLLRMNNNESSSFFRNLYEFNNTMSFPLLVLVLFTLFVGSLGIPYNQEGTDFDILSKWLAPSINLLHQKSKDLTIER